MAKVEIFLKDYKPYTPGTDPVYKLRLTYQALSYFALLNTFQFDMLIYFVLFAFVSLVLVLGIIVFWLGNLQISTFKRPPNLRFDHLRRVTFSSPAFGAFLATIPALMAAGLCVLIRGAELFADQSADWTEGDVSPSGSIVQARGRLGLVLVMLAIFFLQYGAEAITSKPSEDEQEELIEKRRYRLEQEAKEISKDEEDGEEDLQEEEDEKEQDINICRAIDWKQHHFFVCCILLAFVLLMKYEFSYTKIFGRNLQVCLILFTIFDLIIEQLMTRIFMSEALLLSPLLGAIITSEFITTLGSQNFQEFVLAYFIQILIQIFSRTYLGPLMEKLEMFIHNQIVKFSKKYTFVEKYFKLFLIRHLNEQLQRVNLREYQGRGDIEDIAQGTVDPNQAQKTQDDQNLTDRDDGLEALLSCVATYAAHTQALFQAPVALIFLSLLAHETKMAQNYNIRHVDLWYYLTFTVVMIVPRLVIDIFLLHTMETLHGFKIYDYFIFCDYRFRVRTKKWQVDMALDRSIGIGWRSLDNFSFSSQYYFVVSITTWGIILLYLGMTSMIKNDYNPFADPCLIVYVFGLRIVVPLGHSILQSCAQKVFLWDIGPSGNAKVDVGAVNRLDRTNNARKLAHNIQTNPFRHKFMRVNREWLIHNIAVILGGKNYLNHAGAELPYLQAIYQRAVNAEAIEQRLRAEQDKIAQDLALMPYNARAQAKKDALRGEGAALIVVSDDSVSDIPAPKWSLPEGLMKEHVVKFTKMWLAFSRQNMRLKAMVSDLVAKELQPHCRKCRSVYRLQVIQKIGFQQVCDKFRGETQGIQFTVDRWRAFYKRRQVYITLCMECAYIDNLNAAHIVERDGDLQRLMAEMQLQNVGAHDQYVAQKLKKPHVRKIIHRWLWMSRSSLLHQRGPVLKEARLKFRLDKYRFACQEAQTAGQPLPNPPSPPPSTMSTPNPSQDSGGSSDSLTISSVGAC